MRDGALPLVLFRTSRALERLLTHGAQGACRREMVLKID